MGARVQAFHAEDVPLRVPKRHSPETLDLRRIGACRHPGKGCIVGLRQADLVCSIRAVTAKCLGGWAGKGIGLQIPPLGHRKFGHGYLCGV
jgi:hypothetical protein